MREKRGVAEAGRTNTEKPQENRPKPAREEKEKKVGG